MSNLNVDEKLIIDSKMSLEEALISNPQNSTPVEILKKLEMITVNYYGFDLLKHEGQIVINKSLSKDVRKFFDLASQIKFPIKSVIPISDKRYQWDDNLSCEDNNSSGFNYRLIAGTNRISKHGLGCAFDINPVQNIYIRYNKNLNEIFRAPANGIYDKNGIGTLTSDNFLVKFMKDLGWEWGGDWLPESGRVDYQHFEKNFYL